MLVAVQVLALQVFDDRHLRGLLVGDVADERGNLRFAGELRSFRAPRAGNQKIAAVLAGTHHDGLDDAVSLDGVGQLLQLFFRNFGARLVRIAVNLVHGQVQNGVAIGAAQGFGMKLGQNSRVINRADHTAAA